MKKMVFCCLALAMCLGMEIHAQNSEKANFGNYPANYEIAYFTMLGYSEAPTVRDLFENNIPFATKIPQIDIPCIVTIESGRGTHNEYTAVLLISAKNERTGEIIKAYRLQVRFESDNLTKNSFVRYVKWDSIFEGKTYIEKVSFGTPEQDAEVLGIFVMGIMPYFWDVSKLKK